MAKVRRMALCRPLLFAVDGLASYVSAFQFAFGSPLPRHGAPGRPRLVAWQALPVTAYAEFTVDATAHAAGQVKGTVFLYFHTKEEISLELTGQQAAAWLATVDARLARLPAPAQPAEVVGVIADALQERVDFTRLLAILSTVLERNANYDAALYFKQLLLLRLTQTGALLERALPFLPPGEGAHLLLQLEALVIGLRHLADAAPVVRQIMILDEMRVFDVDFDREFRPMVLGLINGMKG